MTRHGWTEERVDRAKALWIDGVSASDIAQRLGGVSRNGVIGKMHRLGLAQGSAERSTRQIPAPPRRIERPTKPKPIVEAVKVAPKAAPMVAVMVRAPQGIRAPKYHYIAPPVDAAGRPEGSKSILELAARDCKYPVGEDDDDGLLYCAAHRAEDDDAYCPHHRMICGGKRLPLAKTVVVPRYAR